MTVRIGLTGPIGCGKSTVAGWLGERPGVVVIDADQVAREVVEPGEPALDAVVARFGPGVLRGRRVPRPGGARPDRLRRPGRAARPRGHHPSGGPAADPGGDRRRRGSRGAVPSSSRRSGWSRAASPSVCDEVWLVTCDPTVQRERLVGRGASSDDAERRIAAQAGFADRVRPIATRVIDTSRRPDGDAGPGRRGVRGGRLAGQNACSVRASHW